MKFSLWLEGRKRNQKSAMKMPKKSSSLELYKKAASKRAFEMQHGKAGTIDPKKKKGSRSQQSAREIRDNM